jgi:hypothetical protein
MELLKLSIAGYVIIIIIIILPSGIRKAFEWESGLGAELSR